MQTRLAEKRITLTATDAAKDWLAIEGYDPAFGARQQYVVPRYQ